jgi:hypothetical protein
MRFLLIAVSESFRRYLHVLQNLVTMKVGRNNAPRYQSFGAVPERR